MTLTPLNLKCIFSNNLSQQLKQEFKKKSFQKVYILQQGATHVYSETPIPAKNKQWIMKQSIGSQQEG